MCVLCVLCACVCVHTASNIVYKSVAYHIICEQFQCSIITNLMKQYGLILCHDSFTEICSTDNRSDIRYFSKISIGYLPIVIIMNVIFGLEIVMKIILDIE